MNLLLPGLALAAGYGIYRFAKGSMDAVDKLTYSVSKVQFKRQGAGAVINVELAITNITDQPLFFDRIDASAEWNGKSIGTTYFDQRTIIAARGTTKVVLPFSPSLIGVVQAIIQAVQGGDFGTVRATGTIKAGPLTIPLEFEAKPKIPGKEGKK